MSETSYHVLGVMSGTSLDGIDLAEIHFTFRSDEGWSFRWGVTETLPYEKQWLPILNEAVHFSAGRLDRLNKEYTDYLAEVISEFIRKHHLRGLDAICSHGHTVLHRPEEQLTLQIGNLPILANKLQQKVICDFRSQDVALGGQGAPLVPIGDRLLFSEYDYCLNLGGFANCSYEEDGLRIAYDICPVNIVLNELTRTLGQPYDKDGHIARKGRLDGQLFEQLNSLDYYKESTPKSLGLEWVQENITPHLRSSSLSIQDQ
ncbi:MAG: anhydro-N-acetylmuramic acid kinase, partial [Flavobacteriaceae bacterium]|nr:anhydro-N-acetylmuramic acid kinase [Flavobacteriaceae bacterium]